jgi:hypothetical protein
MILAPIFISLSCTLLSDQWDTSLGRDEATEEVTEVVGEDEQRQPHLVRDEARTGEAHPRESIFALLDPLLAVSSLVVETYHLLRLCA